MYIAKYLKGNHKTMYKSNYFKRKEERLRKLAELLANKALMYEFGTAEYSNLIQRYRFVRFMYLTRKDRRMYDQRKLP